MFFFCLLAFIDFFQLSVGFVLSMNLENEGSERNPSLFLFFFPNLAMCLNRLK